MSAARSQKRVAAIHDLSGFGRCSLTVALPILSAAGINCAVMPTAALSTHTGGLGEFAYRDLTDGMLGWARHWRRLGLSFDAVYSGFLGSSRQVEIIMEIRAMFGGGIFLVDPVMGDNGRLYPTFGEDFPGKMAKLCGAADIITPNMTEAFLLTGRPYEEGPHDRACAGAMLGELARLFGEEKRYVITGIRTGDGGIGAAALCRGVSGYSFAEFVPRFYPGTGDIFASALLAALLNGADLFEASKAGVDFTAACARRTCESGQDPRFGVQFELELEQIVELGKKHEIPPDF